jgi:hypothetical protein
MSDGNGVIVDLCPLIEIIRRRLLCCFFCRSIVWIVIINASIFLTLFIINASIFLLFLIDNARCCTIWGADGDRMIIDLCLLAQLIRRELRRVE